MRRYTFLLLLALMLLLPLQVAAQTRSIHWERFDIAVDVQDNGDLGFVETQRLVVDSGSFSFGTRSFNTGASGRVRNVQVSESGQRFRAGSSQPGTFTASDNGSQFSLKYYFLDPTASRHEMTISYVVGRALASDGKQAQLAWNFFCATGCPRIDAGSVTIRLPDSGNPAGITASASGAGASQTASGATSRWELTGPIQNTQLHVNMTFPQSLLAPSALFRSTGSAPPVDQPLPGQQPSGAVSNPNVAPAASSISPIFCLIVLIVLFIAFSMMRRSMRRRVYGGPGPAAGGPGLPVGGPFGPGGMGLPRRRRFWGRRGYGGWGGGVPPVIISPPIVPPGDYGGPFNQAPPQDLSSGGGGGSWSDSGGGGGSWSDSGGGGSSWSDSGGGGGSWSDMGGGGGGSWGGGDGGGGGGGGGGDSSSFG